MQDYKQITEAIIGAAIEVHRELGLGLLESAYERCLCHELALRGVEYVCQKNLPVTYKGLELDCGATWQLDSRPHHQLQLGSVAARNQTAGQRAR